VAESKTFPFQNKTKKNLNRNSVFETTKIYEINERAQDMG
jgi:hypothetical protein